MGALVSVNLAIYGSFDKDRLVLAIDSIKKQNYKHVEIILSEQNPTPIFQETVKELSVKYCFSEIQVVDGIPHFSPGLIRNKGLSISEGEFIYTSDCDLVLRDSNYLRSLVMLINTRPNIFLVKPPMRSLVESCFDDFKAIVSENGFELAIKSLYFPDKYYAATRYMKSDLIIVKHGRRKIYKTSEDKFQRYLTDTSFRGFDPRIWSDVIHYGSIFARASQFDAISGYCEKYLHWGYEDVDVQWKLSELFNLQEIPRKTRFEVIHLDHSKNYFSLQINMENRFVLERRIAEGVRSAITSDKKNYKGFSFKNAN